MIIDINDQDKIRIKVICLCPNIVILNPNSLISYHIPLLTKDLMQKMTLL